MPNLYRSLSILLLLNSITACTNVKPWEHAILSRPEMTLSATPLTTIENHIYASKEGSPSHGTVVGGGCDCN